MKRKLIRDVHLSTYGMLANMAADIIDFKVQPDGKLVCTNFTGLPIDALALNQKPHTFSEVIDIYAKHWNIVVGKLLRETIERIDRELLIEERDIDISFDLKDELAIRGMTRHWGNIAAIDIECGCFIEKVPSPEFDRHHKLCQSQECVLSQCQPVEIYTDIIGTSLHIYMCGRKLPPNEIFASISHHDDIHLIANLHGSFLFVRKTEAINHALTYDDVTPGGRIYWKLAHCVGSKHETLAKIVRHHKKFCEDVQKHNIGKKDNVISKIKGLVKHFIRSI